MASFCFHQIIIPSTRFSKFYQVKPFLLGRIRFEIATPLKTLFENLFNLFLITQIS
jgi:hypothetical protein